MQTITPLEVGFSEDKKYHVKNANGTEYLLRVSDLKDESIIRNKFEKMQLAYAKGVPMCAPLKIEQVGNELHQYHSWCEGDTLLKSIYSMTDEMQCAMGSQVGKILQKLHSVPGQGVEAYSHFKEMLADTEESIASCNINIEESSVVLRFCNDNLHILHDRPVSLCHRDCHQSNLLLHDNKLTLLDWELVLYADPWSEFTLFNQNEIHPHYATGLLHSYFDGVPPPEFWPVFYMYQSLHALAIIPWAATQTADGYDPLAFSMQTLKNVMTFSGGLKSSAPTWYIL